MIEVVKRIQITNGTAPFTYQWTSSSSCLTFDKPIGSTDGVIETKLTFTDTKCVPTITLKVIASCGSEQTFDISNTLPCKDMIVSNISENKRVFSVTASNTKCAEHSFKWDYDTSIWEETTSQSYPYGSSIALVKNSNVLTKANTAVKVTVTDSCYGCSVVKSFTYSFNVFISELYLARLPEYLDVDVFKYTGSVTIKVPVGMVTQGIKVIFLNLPSHTTYTNDGLTYTFTTTSKETVTFDYYLQDINNDKSIKGSITLIPEVGSADYPVVITDIAREVCNESNEYRISVYNSINSTTDIDWDSFVILNDPTPVSSSITFDTVKKEIVYIKPAGFNTDVFKFTVADSAGLFGKSGTVTLTKCIIPPTVVDDTVTIQSGTTVKITPLANDLSNGGIISPQSLKVLNVPEELIVVPDLSIGGLTITPIYGSAGTYTFNYVVSNTSGKESNIGTITVEVVYAGADVSIVVCN